MDQHKTILLLGGSFQQLVAIRAAKELGLRTVLCDYLPDNPGQHEVDKYYNVSTTDVEAVYQVAKEEKVDGILAYASDPAALPAAIVCERLGLPTNPAKSVEILGVKHKFREFLGTHGFACPKNFTFHPQDDAAAVAERLAELQFPIIIKPTDSSGSKGVTKLESAEGLQQAIEHADEYSRNKILIAEEFIERGFPNVIGGDIFVWDGKIILYGEMSCLRGDNGNSLIPIGKMKPSGLNEHQTQQVHTELQRMIDALGIRFGEMNIEIILDKDDNVHFLELGPRAGGNMIPIQLSDAFGIDLPRANVIAAIGENPELKPEEQKGCYCHYVIHSDTDGIYKGLSISPEIEPYIYRKVIYKSIGDRVEAFDGAGKAVGIVFLRFPDVRDFKKLYANCNKHIRPFVTEILNTMNDLIIVCAGGFGKEVLALAEAINRATPTWNILGFIDDTKEVGEPIYHGYNCVGSIKDYQPKKGEYLAMGISTPKAKEKLYELLKSRGANFATLIHPAVTIQPETVIGEGCIIYENSMIGSENKFGKCVHIASSMVGASDIDDFSTTTGFANIAAAHLGKRVFVGSHAVVLNKLKVGDDAFICAGSIVFSNVEPGTKVLGYPAENFEI